MNEFDELTNKLSNLFLIESPQNDLVLQRNVAFDDTKYDAAQRWGHANANDIATHVNSPHLSVVERVLINTEWPKDNTVLSDRSSIAWAATSGYLTVGYEFRDDSKSKCYIVAMTQDGTTNTSNRDFSVVATRVFRNRILVVSPHTLYVLDDRASILHKCDHNLDVDAFSKQGCPFDFNESVAYFAIGRDVYEWNPSNAVYPYRSYAKAIHRICCDGARIAVSFESGEILIEPDNITLSLFEPTSMYDALHGRNVPIPCEPGPLTDMTLRGAYVAASCGNFRAVYHLLERKLCIKEGGVDNVYLYGSLLLSTFVNAKLCTGMLVEPAFDYEHFARYFESKISSDALAFAYANRTIPLLPSVDPEERHDTDLETYKLCKEFERGPGTKRQIFALTGGDVTVIRTDNSVIRKEF